MKEFGSDFHKVISFDGDKNNFFPVNCIFYSCGRQAIEDIIKYQGYKRLWFPEYYCHDIINYIVRRTHIEVRFYYDTPLADDLSEIENIIFKKGDALMRMNYFGIRGFRDETNISVPVIEDHSHDMCGEWVMKSSADWCIASLRKIFPIAEGGVLWSPKCHTLPNTPAMTEQNNLLAEKRWLAMELKNQYLFGDNNISKELYRGLFIETENEFDELNISLIDNTSMSQFSRIDLLKWDKSKQDNIETIKTLLSESTDKIRFLSKENECCHEFSVILIFNTSEERDKARERLIQNRVYPAILWRVPPMMSLKAQEFSRCSLSIACDGRYSKDDILDLSAIILNSIS